MLGITVYPDMSSKVIYVHRELLSEYFKTGSYVKFYFDYGQNRLLLKILKKKQPYCKKISRFGDLKKGAYIQGWRFFDYIGMRFKAKESLNLDTAVKQADGTWILLFEAFKTTPIHLLNLNLEPTAKDLLKV